MFSYQDIHKERTTEIMTEEKGSDGRYSNKKVPWAPSEAEYRYNVEQYLTYVMTKKQFKARFGKM